MTQNITTIRSSPNDSAAALHSDTTDNISTVDEPGKASGHKLSDQSGVEVVCGPVELAKYVDLSGTQGVVPLTSMKLLKVKSKSFLLRFKSKSSRSDKSAAAVDKPTQVVKSVLLFSTQACLESFTAVIVTFHVFHSAHTLLPDEGNSLKIHCSSSLKLS